MQRDELADEEDMERRLRLQPGKKRGPRRRRSRPARAPEQGRTPRGRIRRASRCPQRRRPPAGMHVGRRRARRRPQATRAQAATVVDERVVEGDERVEDDRPPTGDPLRGGEVEVPRVADDDRVRVAGVLAGSAQAFSPPRRRARSAAGRRTSCAAAPTPPGVALAPRRRRLAGPRSPGRYADRHGRTCRSTRPASSAELRPRAWRPGPRLPSAPRGGS